MSLKRFVLALICLPAAYFVTNSHAAVERIEIRERVPFADGKLFGEFGAYEKLRGVAYFAVDPKHSANARIVDLKYAPRDARGMVTFSSEFVMLRPVPGAPNAKRTSLLYDVNNRGGIAILGQVNGRSPANNDPTSEADAGDGFLMRHGFTLLFSAWTWDVAPQASSNRPLIFNAPVVMGPNGKSITGKVYNEVIVDAPTEIATYAGFRGLTFEPALSNDPKAVMTTRDRPDSSRKVVPRSKWQFFAPDREGGPGRVKLDGSFQPGTIYELTYVAKDPRVTGLGLAGIRDLLAHFRDTPFEGASTPKNVLIFGISQSGRLIGRMMHDGLNVDETVSSPLMVPICMYQEQAARLASIVVLFNQRAILRCCKSTTTRQTALRLPLFQRGIRYQEKLPQRWTARKTRTVAYQR